MRLFRLAAFAVPIFAFLGSGCSGGFDPSPATSLDGQWTRERPAGEPPLFWMQMLLHDSSGVVNGTGTWSGEAGPFGPLTIDGTFDGSTVRLHIVYGYDPRFSMPSSEGTFVGVLDGVDELVGTTTRAGGLSQTDRFARGRLN